MLRREPIRSRRSRCFRLRGVLWSIRLRIWGSGVRISSGAPDKLAVSIDWRERPDLPIRLASCVRPVPRNGSRLCSLRAILGIAASAGARDERAHAGQQQQLVDQLGHDVLPRSGSGKTTTGSRNFGSATACGPLGFIALMRGDHGEPQAPSTGSPGSRGHKGPRPSPGKPPARLAFCCHVAFASCRLHRPLPPYQSWHAPLRRDVAARDQAWRLARIARKDGDRVRLYSRPGNDLSIWLYDGHKRQSHREHVHWSIRQHDRLDRWQVHQYLQWRLRRTGTIGNKRISTYEDGYGYIRGTIGRDLVNTNTDPSGVTTGTIGRRRVNCFTDRLRTTKCY